MQNARLDPIGCTKADLSNVASSYADLSLSLSVASVAVFPPAAPRFGGVSATFSVISASLADNPEFELSVETVMLFKGKRFDDFLEMLGEKNKVLDITKQIGEKVAGDAAKSLNDSYQGDSEAHLPMALTTYEEQVRSTCLVSGTGGCRI